MGDNFGRMQRFVGRAWGEVKGSLYRNAIFIMLSSVIGSGLGFFFWFFASFVYKKEDIGSAIALFQTLGFLATLALFGQNFGLVRYLPETEDKTTIVNTALSITGVACLLLSIVFLIGIPLWASNLDFVLRNPQYIGVIIVCTMALGFAPLVDQTAIAMRRADISTWQNTIFALLKIAIVLAMAVLLGGRLGVFLSLSLALGGSILITGFFMLPRIVPGYRPAPRMDLDRVRPMFRFNLGNYVAQSIGAAGTLLLPLLILNGLGPLAGPSNVAYFYVALIVAGLLYVIPGATFTSFYAEASHGDSSRKMGERKAILLSIALLVPAIAVLWLYSGLMLSLFGDPGYAAKAVEPLRILSIGAIPGFLNGVLVTRVRIRKETRPLIISAAIGTVITLALGWVLLLRMGIDGLAIAYVVAQAAATPYLFLVAGRSLEEAVPTEPMFGPPVE